MNAEYDNEHLSRDIVCLIGYRGTGKTSVAAQLAARLGWQTLDSDHVVETTAGRSIAEIFATDGEPSFRDLEGAAVKAILSGQQRVASLGGGAILREENRDRMAATASVVWLQAEAETIHQRLANDPATSSQRPNLTADGGLPEIVRVLEDRDPLYRECADLVVDTENKDVATVAAEILDRLDLPPENV